MNLKAILAGRCTIAVVACALAGCGTTPGVNSEVPSGVYLGAGRPDVSDPASVKIVDTGPPNPEADQRVAGTSCMNKLWDPPPSEANAVALMKQQAASRGYDAIYAVEVAPDPTAIAKNCWKAIHARGIAFHATDTSSPQPSPR